MLTLLCPKRVSVRVSAGESGFFVKGLSGIVSIVSMLLRRVRFARSAGRGYVNGKKKERKKTDNPREGWEDGTPPPHRDFKERGVWCYPSL